MTRRSRALTGEERRLWAEVARAVRPLVGRLAEPQAAEVPARPAPESACPSPSPAPTPARRAEPPRLAPLTPLERRTTRSLSRGKARPDATLDLHGLTQAEAHARLVSFLRRAKLAGHGLVLVVTGRGEAGGERGVLRRSVPHWLGVAELRPIVLGFQPAGPRQGGDGALYVRLRRRLPREPGSA